MKQHITFEQWNELKGGRQGVLINNLGLLSIPRKNETELMNIGQMIEFLGDDWTTKIWYDDEPAGIMKPNDELCDVLWEAVKYKLSNSIKVCRKKDQK